MPSMSIDHKGAAVRGERAQRAARCGLRIFPPLAEHVNTLLTSARGVRGTPRIRWRAFMTRANLVAKLTMMLSLVAVLSFTFPPVAPAAPSLQNRVFQLEE